MEDIKRMEVKTNEKCELCGSPLLLKWGKFGSFYACSAYNKKDPTSCTFTKENTAAKPDLNTPEAQEAGEQEEYCENCGKVMVLRRGPFGMFMACPDYNADPPCKTFRKLSQKQQQKQTAPQPTGEDCPACGKPLVLRQGAYGEFVSCSGYPKCKYVKQNLIEGMKCPKCGDRRHRRAQGEAAAIFSGDARTIPSATSLRTTSRCRRSAPSAAARICWRRRSSPASSWSARTRRSGAEEEAPKKRGKKTEPDPQATVVCTLFQAHRRCAASAHGGDARSGAREGRQEEGQARTAARLIPACKIKGRPARA